MVVTVVSTGKLVSLEKDDLSIPSVTFARSQAQQHLLYFHILHFSRTITVPEA